MATADTSLETLLREYITSVGRRPIFSLIQKLLSTSADDRYDCLREVQDDIRSFSGQLLGVYGLSKPNKMTAVHVAARSCDVELLQCMLREFTFEQKYKIMQLSNNNRLTPLLSAVTYHRVGRNPSETVKFLFTDLSADQMYELLKAQHIAGDTALHGAVRANYTECIQPFLSSLTLGQQHHLLSIKGWDGRSVVEISPSISTNYMTMTTVKELTDSKQKVEMQKQQIAAQKQEIDAQKGSIAALENAMQVMTERQQATEMMLEQLQIELRRPIVTDETGDQEIEELEDE